MDRNEDMVYSGYRHPYRGTYRVGCTSEGKLTALETELYSNGGYSSDESVPVSSFAIHIHTHTHTHTHTYTHTLW